MPIRSLSRVLGVVPVLLLAGLLAGCHPAAPGGTVRLIDVDNQIATTYQQDVSGTNSNLTVRYDGVAFNWNDGKGLTAGTGCTQVDDHRVRCVDIGVNQGIFMNLGDGNDTATNATTFSADMFGGAGDDTLTGSDSAGDTLRGEAGNDTLTGRGGDDLLLGGTDNDSLSGGAGNDDLRDGNTDADTDIFSGGDDVDSISYLDSSTGSPGVTVTIGDGPNDGLPGEGDDVMSDVEDILGSSGDDFLTGDDDANTIVGSFGNDFLFGLGGDDVLDGQGGTDFGLGGNGSDVCTVEVPQECEG